MSSRLSMAVHILCLIGTMPAPTGDVIAGSVNTNPVVIRRIMRMLKQAGLIQVRPGVGGSKLLRDPDRITLLDVYHAVDIVEGNSMFGMHEHPNPACPVGRMIAGAMRREFDEAQRAMEQRLSQTTIRRLMDQVGRERAPS
ncbi:Rrf2 family transcriptional regulator [Paenibacillus sabuli]|nr:Rrf2 family transcriptional regulator [Paenibacillus sabuli]